MKPRAFFNNCLRDKRNKKKKIIGIHSASEINQNELLLVRFPNLGSDDIIIPGMANLSINIKLDSTNDKNRTSVSSR